MKLNYRLLDLFGLFGLVVLLAGCSSLTLQPHTGTIPERYKAKYYPGTSEQDTNLAELVCAQGDERTAFGKAHPFQIFFEGAQAPKLTVAFTDDGFWRKQKRYKAVKLAPSKRSFDLILRSYNALYRSSQHARAKVADFEFQANLQYFAKYQLFDHKTVNFWIEDQNGKVVYGQKNQ